MRIVVSSLILQFTAHPLCHRVSELKWVDRYPSPDHCILSTYLIGNKNNLKCVPLYLLKYIQYKLIQ